MNGIALTKFQSVVLAILGCISISLGAGEDMQGYLADLFLVFGGAVVCAALITPTYLPDGDHTDE